MSATSQCSIKTDGTTMLLLGEAFVFLMRKKQADLFAVLAQNAAYLTGGKQV